MIGRMFASECDPRVDALRVALRDFYMKRPANEGPENKMDYSTLWRPIRAAIDERLRKNGNCRVLEFGAGRTRFGECLKDVRAKVVFDVEEINPNYTPHLSTQADNVYMCDVKDIKNRYDIIFSSFTLEHLTDPKAVIGHLLGILNNGGSMFIISPHYDFPFYISPSATHLSIWKRAAIAMWLLCRRLKVMAGGHPDFLIHLDPAVFHLPLQKDFDAIHWLSLWDIKRCLPEGVTFRQIRLSIPGLKSWFWTNFLLMFCEIKKPEV